MAKKTPTGAPALHGACARQGCQRMCNSECEQFARSFQEPPGKHATLQASSNNRRTPKFLKINWNSVCNLWITNGPQRRSQLRTCTKTSDSNLAPDPDLGINQKWRSEPTKLRSRFVLNLRRCCNANLLSAEATSSLSEVAPLNKVLVCEPTVPHMRATRHGNAPADTPKSATRRT